MPEIYRQIKGYYPGISDIRQTNWDHQYSGGIVDKNFAKRRMGRSSS